MQDIEKGGSSYCAREAREKIFVDHAHFCVTTKEPVSFLIVAVINKAKTPKIV